MKNKLLEAIHEANNLGFEVCFSRFIGQNRIVFIHKDQERKVETTVLPDDHINDDLYVKAIKFNIERSNLRYEEAD